MKKKIIVAGLGNPLMADEGIGGFLVKKLAEKADKFPDVDFIDAGTGGMNLLHLISERQKAILLDCAFMDTIPGTIRKFGPDQVKSVKKLAHFSLHEADVLQVLAMAKELGIQPEQVVLFGIEPVSVEPQQKISDLLASQCDQYLNMILEELA